MASGRGAARNAFRVDLKSNAREVLAYTREMGQLMPGVLTTHLANITLAGLRQAELNGIVRGNENLAKKHGSWYSKPAPGADHQPALPTLHDLRTGSAKMTYIRDAKGHIKGRKAEHTGRADNYLFRDKVVSRTGRLDDMFEFDWNAKFKVDQWKLQGSHEYVFLKNLDGATISAMGSTVLFRTTPDEPGQKIAFLERSRADRGRLQPRYFIRRNLQSVARRYSTTFKREMAAAERLARKAAASARSKA